VATSDGEEQGGRRSGVESGERAESEA
jgi:hypothetical protein